jgi:hypothetical protein
MPIHMAIPAECLSRPAFFAPVLLILAALISVWFANHGLPTNDEGVVLTWAAQILRGKIFYREIDAYQFPGASYFLAFWMHLLGEHLAVARALAGAVYCSVVLILYFTALKLLDRKRAALFGLFLLCFKFLANPAFTTYMYSDLSFCFGCGAIALLSGHTYRGPSTRLLAAGVCIGIALTSKQNLGIYLGAATVALLAFPGVLLGIPRRSGHQRWSELAVLLTGLAIPVLPMLTYFFAHGVLWDMAYSGLVRPFLGYFPTSGISFLEPLKWWELGELRGLSAFPYCIGPLWSMLMRYELPGEAWYPVYWTMGEILSRLIYTSIPIAFIASAAVWMRRIRKGQDSDRDRKLFAFAILSLAITVSAFPRADFFHVISVYPLALLLIGSLLSPVDGKPSGAQSSRSRPWIGAVILSVFLVATGVLSFLYHSHMSYRMKLPKADFYVLPEISWVESIVRFILDEVAQDERLFVYGNEAYYYFFTSRFSPWPFAQLYPGQTGDDEGQELVALLQREPPKLVIRGFQGWPGVREISSYAPVLEGYITDQFEEDDPPVVCPGHATEVITTWSALTLCTHLPMLEMCRGAPSRCNPEPSDAGASRARPQGR